MNDTIREPNDAYGAVTYNLGKILTEKAMTVKELARLANMNPVVLQKAIDGETWPSRQHLERVCSVLNVHPCVLFSYTPAS